MGPQEIEIGTGGSWSYLQPESILALTGRQYCLLCFLEGSAQARKPMSESYGSLVIGQGPW